MFRNYLVVAWRNLVRNKLYSAINVLGLAIGLSFCALISLYVSDELTYDHFHAQRDQIYRLYEAYYHPDGSTGRNEPILPMPLGPAVKDELPEVEQFVRFTPWRGLVKTEAEALVEDILFADESIFEVFTFPLLRGDPKKVLADLNSVVLTEQMARKYFGGADPMGQKFAIRVNDRFEDFVVTGIAAEVPGNSSIRLGILLPFARFTTFAFGRGAANDWKRSSFVTFVRLKEGSSASTVEEKLVSFREKYYPGEVQELRGKGRWSDDGFPVRYRLQPLTDIHLNSEIVSSPEIEWFTPVSRPMYSYILGGIALAVLLIACINFTTLAIGRSTSRTREIGVRKAIGAQRGQLRCQFWCEALLLSSLALALGLVLAELFLPIFNGLTGKTLRSDYWSNAWTLFALVGLMFATGLMAGSYPALVLASLRPVEALKNRTWLRFGGTNVLTRLLVVTQFTLAVFLIVGTFAMRNQINYLRMKDLGFDGEQVVVIPTRGFDGQQTLRFFQSELSNRSEITGLTGVSFAFTQGGWRYGFMYKGEPKRFYMYRVEPNFIKTLGMSLTAGRDFDSNIATDSTNAAIINEAMVRDLGWTEPVGQVLSGLFEDDPARDPMVIGVVKDFNFQSLHNSVKPALMILGMDKIRFLLVRIHPGSMSTALPALRATWEKVAPEMPFTYSFLDDDLQAQYRNDQRWSHIVLHAALFAILIACLGLVSLTALAVTRRTKEIGIRKVLGASVPSIVALLSKEFTYLVLAANLIAWPLAWYAMHRWLESFAYRIELGPGVFVLGGVLALAIAWLTVSYQAIRAARANPVEALRYE